jgi:lipoyl(octanoyl) transferase
MRSLHPFWLGRRRYEPVHRLQQRLQQQRIAGRIGDTVLFVEHEPVVTLGRGTQRSHILYPLHELEARGIELVETGRGGDVTLHLPGQLVCYPILDLAPDRRDVRRYVRDLTEVMRLLAADFGVAAGSIARYIGLWANESSPDLWPGELEARAPVKLGAIGVRISRWVTMHGFAFNLSPDLGAYRVIVPCGISEHAVSSIAALTGKRPSVREAAERALTLLERVFDADARPLVQAESLPLDQWLELDQSLEAEAVP